MIPLTLGQVATATGGRLDDGTDPEAVISGGVTLDSRAVGPGDLFVALAGQRVDGHDFAVAATAAGAVAVLAAHPVGVPAVLVQDPVAALGLLARAVRDRLPELTVIAVTGSVGKTSTKDLLAAVVARAGDTVATQGSYNNELGLPLTVLRADAGTRFLVVEMGARGIGHIAYLCGITRPDIGLVLNIGTAHAAVFGTRQATAQTKGELVEALPKTGLAVLNADDPLVAAMAGRTQARVLYTTISHDVGATTAGTGIAAQIRAGRVRLDDQARARFDLITPAGTAAVGLAVHGEHQVANALAAAAVGIEIGLPVAVVAQALSAAGPASHWRMEVRHRGDGLMLVNDAYNANPESVAAALRALVAMSNPGPDGPGAPSRHWAVLGEMLELGPSATEQHRAVGRLAVTLAVDGLVGVGTGGEWIMQGARAAATEQAGPDASGVTLLWAEDVARASRLVQQNVGRTDIVLIKASRSVGLERLAAGLLVDPEAEAEL